MDRNRGVLWIEYGWQLGQGETIMRSRIHSAKGITQTSSSKMKKVVESNNPGSHNRDVLIVFVDLIAIPAILTPSGVRDCHLTSGASPCNAVRWGAIMASGGLRQMLLETTPS